MKTLSVQWDPRDWRVGGYWERSGAKGYVGPDGVKVKNVIAYRLFLCPLPMLTICVRVFRTPKHVPQTSPFDHKQSG